MICCLCGPLRFVVTIVYVISATTAISKTTIAFMNLTYCAEKKALPMAWDSTGIVVVFISNIMLPYSLP